MRDKVRIIDAQSGSLEWFAAAGLNGAVHQSLVDTVRAIWAGDFDPRLLELVRLRIAELLRCDAELGERTQSAIEAGVNDETVLALRQWPTSDLFDQRDRTVLAWVEQWLFDVQGIRDEDANAVQQLFSPKELAHLTLALAVFEALIRARVALAV